MLIASFYLLYLQPYPPHPLLHSFPTRRSSDLPHVDTDARREDRVDDRSVDDATVADQAALDVRGGPDLGRGPRSEEHTSELQSHSDLVCRLLLEKKKKIQQIIT